MKTSIDMPKITFPQITCHYCKANAKQTTGKEVYPHREDLHHKTFYVCAPCGAYVGCHEGTTKRLGLLANASDRQLKVEAHAAFDALWKTYGMKRGEAYAWLADAMGVKKKDCHIGWFTTDQLNEAIRLSKAEVVRRFGISLDL